MENKKAQFSNLYQICKYACLSTATIDKHLPNEKWIIGLYNSDPDDIEKYIANNELYTPCNMGSIPDNNYIEIEKYIWVGHYYKAMKNYDLMKKYYLMAIDKDKKTGIAATWLAYYYEDNEKNYDLMKKYYLMAIDNNNAIAMNNLGYHYMQIEKDYDLMKKYCLMANSFGVADGAYNLAFYYCYIERNYISAIKYYIIYFERKQSNSNFDYIIKHIVNPIICCYICNKLNINVPSSHNYYKYYIKINKHMSNHNCEICVTDNVECVPVNWCGHKVCIYCYINLYNKACPYCRMA